ncbi:MAG: tetratricopeptide repeat protein [Oscillospiraceae bacterium]|nr:tetratricopeptide repeat protein [Oscillospiraceae bacterium]
MKIRTKKSQLKASRIFTDREEPRAAFWQQYRRLEEEIAQEEANVHVLTYYGIGGIGKSSLLKKIMEEMDERVEDPLYVYFDFNLQQESRHVLDALKNKLAESCKFEFPLYELGAYIYAKKVGENPDAPEVKPLLKKSPAVELLLNIAGEIPVVGSATKILDLAEKGVAAFRGYLQEHRKELRQIEYMEAEELYDYLPSLFAEDLTHAMEKCDAPLVILLDTYERLVNEMSSTGEPLSKDVWLRGEDGLVQNVPGVLWVIAGREKLKWERFDSEWKEALEQHLLGSLSSQDSDQFLLAAGVADAALRSDLYDLTMGTPVYLDLCVDQYRRLVERGAEPRTEMFGRDTFDLIERFARYMDDAQKDIVYVLSCMGHWNDSEIAAIARQVIPGFSITTYEKVKGLSFITQSDDGDYNIHQTVGEVLLESCPALLRENTARCGLDHFGAVLKEAGIMEPRYAEALGYCVRFAIMLHGEDDNALWGDYVQYVREPLHRMTSAGGFAQAERVLESLLRHAEERTDSPLYGNVYAEYSHILRAKGDYPASLAAGEKAWTCLCACLGKEHEDTLEAGKLYANILWQSGMYAQALEISTHVYETRRRLLGEEHPDTLVAMRSLAMDLSYNNRDEDALELNGRALEKMQRVFGPTNPETLLAMANRVSFLKYVGRKEESLTMAEEVLALRRAALGDTHPNTLMSMANLADSLEKLQRHEEALPIRREVLEKRREVLGGKHPTTIASGGSLADVLYRLQRYEEALPLYLEVYEGRCEVLGEKQKDTLTTANDIAYCLRDMGRREEALSYYRIAVEGRREVLGPKHSSTLWSMDAWAGVLYNLGRYEEALPLYEEARAGFCEIKGSKSEKAIHTAVNQADTLYALKRYEEALPLYLEAYEGRRELLGEKDPKTLTTANDLAYCLRNMGRREEALEYFRITVEGRREVLGAKHRSTLWSVDAWAGNLYHLGRYEEALPLYREVYEGRLECYGWDNKDTTSVAYNLGVTLKRLGKYEEALPLYRQLYQACCRIYGRDHAETVDVMSDVGFVLSKLDRREEAMDTYFEMAKICHEDPDKRSLELMAEKNVAILLWMVDREEEARELCRYLVQDFVDLYGADHQETATIVRLYRQMGGE